MKIETRIAMEKRIVKKLVDALIANQEPQFFLSVDDGGDEFACRLSRMKKEIMDALLNTDMDAIIVSVVNPNFDKTKPKGEGNRPFRRYGWINLVYGNDGWDVIQDYTVNLESVIKPIMDYCNEQEKKYG